MFFGLFFKVGNQAPAGLPNERARGSSNSAEDTISSFHNDNDWLSRSVNRSDSAIKKEKKRGRKKQSMLI